MSKPSSSLEQYYRVYLAKFKISLRDPDLPWPRFHHVLFVETNPSDESGIKFHVVGDITRSIGMTYESKEYHNPQNSDNIQSKELLGYTHADGCQSRFDALLGSLPTPPQQKAYNPTTNTTELVKSWEPLTFYAPGEPRHLPWKCTEWTNEYAMPALWEAGYIFETVPGDASGSAADADPVSTEWVWDQDYNYNNYRRWSQGQGAWVWAD